MAPEEAHQFAQSWLAGWNAHDLDSVLSHFDDDAVFTSPVAAQLLPDTAGQLEGKDAIRRYWTIGLERIPDLHFEIVNVYTGLDVIVINYRNHVGGLVSEVLHLNDAGLVTYGAGTYLVAMPQLPAAPDPIEPTKAKTPACPPMSHRRQLRMFLGGVWRVRCRCVVRVVLLCVG